MQWRKGFIPKISGIRFSGILIFLLACVFILRDVQLSNYDDDGRVIEGDVLHYYAYLPALLVYNDLKLNFVAEDPGVFSDRFWPAVAPNGKFVIMTTMGLSIMYAPFIIPTHYYLKFTGQPALGYSKPYKIALLFSSIFYVILALVLIRKLLSAYYSDKIISLVLICITLGTNLIQYVTREAAFSHAYSFFLITWFLYNTNRYFQKPKFINAFILGFSAGLIILVRPTNILVLIILPLWGIITFRDLKIRFLFFLQHWRHIIVFTLAIAIIWAPQIIYWKYTSGLFFFNGYGDGSKFFFNNPQFLNILFSYRKGWLLYTPIMILPIIGFFWLYKLNKGVFWALFLYFLLNTYVLASWWLWWFGGSYGNRAFIDMYGVLSLPLAALISYLYSRKNLIVKILPIALIILFVSHNLFQLQQYENSAIHYVSMTKEAYWDSFGRLNPSPNFNDLLVFPDYDAAKEGRYPEPIVRIHNKNTLKTIEFYKSQIRNSPDLMKQEEEKARVKNISIDSSISLDAKWLFEKNKDETN